MSAVIETTTAGKGVISESVKREIIRTHERARLALGEAVCHAIECGRLLIEAKAQADHGSWLPWLDENFPASHRTAQGYMKLAAHVDPDGDEDAQALADLGIEGALKQLAAPRRQHHGAVDGDHRGAVDGEGGRGDGSPVRDHPPAPYEINTERQAQLAHADRKRFESLVGTCGGLAMGLPGLKVERALAVATAEEIRDWESTIRDGEAALAQLRKRIRQAGA